MVQRMGGLRRKTRYKFTKETRRRGKISITRYFQSFNVGDKVYLHVEPAVQKGMYHPRFMGNGGIIAGKRGRCYIVNINDRGKQKELIVHPVHLKRV
ncbi:MAG TPA: 50S ribosomal protein L21e [Candidatus Nanoarchaeia archaeon]|nr:50S ribosomal protein L21e [Candidatus Nanoarchaeia archaeon]